jgi:hypothetical protein
MYIEHTTLHELVRDCAHFFLILISIVLILYTIIIYYYFMFIFCLKAPSDIFPADHGWLMNNYDNAMRDNDGGDGPFQYGSSTGTCYSVSPGTYILHKHKIIIYYNSI